MLFHVCRYHLLLGTHYKLYQVFFYQESFPWNNPITGAPYHVDLCTLLLYLQHLIKFPLKKKKKALYLTARIIFPFKDKPILISFIFLYRCHCLSFCLLSSCFVDYSSKSMFFYNMDQTEQDSKILAHTKLSRSLV